jgi:hypothetical protein
MAISEVVIGGIVKAMGEWLNDFRKANQEYKLIIDDSHARPCLLAHVAWVEQWSSSISMLNLRKDKRLADAFVELNLDIGFFRYGNPDFKQNSVTIAEVFRSNDIAIRDNLNSSKGHVAILGRPGAGKTTSLQRIAHLALRDREDGTGGVPILVMLRDLRDGEGLVSHLLGKLGITVHVSAKSPFKTTHLWEQRILHAYLDLVSAILLVDGLDEVDPRSRLLVEAELRDIALAPGKHRLFLTSRTAEYNVDIQHVQAYTILPLSEEKIENFAHRWLGDERGNEFLRAIKQNPYAGTEVVPLTLAHLCAIYDRDGSLPSRPVDVYEAIISLLVEQWDRERGISRVSRYADFTPRKKERFLQAVAFELAMAGRKGAFRHEDLRNVYQRIAAAFGLPEEEEEAVILEVESHTGLVLQIGFRRYQFVHLVIQEFLTAMHAQRTPNGFNFLVPGYPNEMALVAAYSTSAEEYLEEVIKLVLPHNDEEQVQQFAAAFVARLSIERVTVEPTARNGWVLLAYLDLLGSRRSVETQRFHDITTDEIQFFFADSSREAIRLALCQAKIARKASGVRVKPVTLTSIPHFLIPVVQQSGLFVRHLGNASIALPISPQ